MPRRKRAKSPKPEGSTRERGTLRTAWQKLKSRFSRQGSSHDSVHAVGRSEFYVPPPLPTKSRLPISVTHDPITGHSTYISLEKTVVPSPPGGHHIPSAPGHYAAPRVPAVPVDHQFAMRRHIAAYPPSLMTDSSISVMPSVSGHRGYRALPISSRVQKLARHGRSRSRSRSPKRRSKSRSKSRSPRKFHKAPNLPMSKGVRKVFARHGSPSAHP